MSEQTRLELRRGRELRAEAASCMQVGILSSPYVGLPDLAECMPCGRTRPSSSKIVVSHQSRIRSHGAERFGQDIGGPIFAANMALLWQLGHARHPVLHGRRSPPAKRDHGV